MLSPVWTKWNRGCLCQYHDTWEFTETYMIQPVGCFSRARIPCALCSLHFHLFCPWVNPRPLIALGYDRHRRSKWVKGGGFFRCPIRKRSLLHTVTSLESLICSAYRSPSLEESQVTQLRPFWLEHSQHCSLRHWRCRPHQVAVGDCMSWCILNVLQHC